MSNLSLSPQLINNLSQAILERFAAAHQSSNNTSPRTPQNDLVSKLANSLHQSISASFSPASQKHIDVDDGAAVGEEIS